MEMWVNGASLPALTCAHIGKCPKLIVWRRPFHIDLGQGPRDLEAQDLLAGHPVVVPGGRVPVPSLVQNITEAPIAPQGLGRKPAIFFKVLRGSWRSKRSPQPRQVLLKTTAQRRAVT